jgi:hypothetical protein
VPGRNAKFQFCLRQQSERVLFAGMVEVLYEMRCTLFHGELAPTKEAVVCYEPAFRLVRRFLDCVV